MKQLSGLLFFALVAAACGNGGGGQEDSGVDGGPEPCDLADHPCPDGERCTADQECVPADPLVITTESLPDGRVGFGYDQTLEAGGGLVPYTWEIAAADPELAFLTITAAGRLQGSTDQPIQDASITIAVNDSGYGGGERAERIFSVSFDLCREGDIEHCYAPVGGVCHQGSRTCTGGQMGECLAGADPSEDRNQCGPDCSRCVAEYADACHQGLCACGDGPLCSGDDRCCDGQCLDVWSSTAHCGMCFNDCEQAVAHASGEKSCSAGVCDYLGDCDYGFLDCDGQRSNGCERPANRVDTCGACDVDCNVLIGHVSQAQKICTDTGAGFVCDYTGSCGNDFADCDDDRSNGCETWLTETTSCGGCGVDCALSAAGSLCISPDPADPYFHTCGCNFDSATGRPEGCAAGQICCEHICRDAASDGEHCGVCRAACTTGGCVGGACGCVVPGDCPAPSSATSCGGDRCVCVHSGGDDAPCPVGQFCCDGSEGGSGGPQGEADLGCCVKRCGQNDEESFSCNTLGAD